MKASLSFERRPYDPNEKVNRDFAHYLHHGEFMATLHTDKGECYCSDCVDARDRGPQLTRAIMAAVYQRFVDDRPHVSRSQLEWVRLKLRKYCDEGGI